MEEGKEKEAALEETGALADFLLLCRTDLERGGLRPLEHYSARFPGLEAAIAREYAALTAGQVQRAPPALAARGYRVIDVLGHGGQGVVYLAEDRELGRLVAVKTLFAALGSGSANRLARLQRETAMLARIDHPGICAVLRAHLEDDPPFLVLRYVRGTTLARLLARPRGAGVEGALACPPRDRAELARVLEFFERAAEALHIAHGAGVMHRDIKPANLMVDEGGRPVLLDFGLARNLTEVDHGLTRTGEVLGSPAYMSPEQFDGAGGELDARTDVYSLGVTLFECLTGRRPFEAPSQHQLENLICSEPVPHVSRLNPVVHRDLDVVLAMAMEKDRSKRYSTALDLADELRRVREKRPIHARPTRLTLRMQRWCQRNPAIATALGLIGLAALGLLAATLLLLRERERTRLALRVSESRNLAASALRDLELEPMTALQQAIEAHAMAASVHTRSVLFAASARQRVERVFRQYTAAPQATIGPNSVTPDGSAWLAEDKESGLALYHSSGAAPLALWPLCHASAVALSPDARHAALGLASGEVRRFDPSRGESRVVATHRGPVRALALSARGLLASGGEDNLLRLQPDGPDPARELGLGFVVGGLRFSPAGDRLVIWPGEVPEARAEATAVVVDALAGTVLCSLAGHTERIDEVAFSASGTRLATASDDRTLRVWDITSGQCLLVVPFPGKLHDVAFSPDDERLIVGFDPGAPGQSDSSGAWVLALHDGRRLLELRGHESRAVVAVDWSSDGATVLTGSYDGSVRVWQADDGRPVSSLRSLSDTIFDACFLQGDDRILVRRRGDALVARVGVWSPESLLSGHRTAVLRATFSRVGDRVASIGRDGRVLLHSMRSGERLAGFHVEGATEVLFVAEEALVVASLDGAVRLFRAPDGEQVAEVRLGVEPVRTLARCRTDGEFVASSGARVVRCDARGVVLREYVGHTGAVTCIDLSQDGRLLACGAADRSASVFDLATGARLARFTEWDLEMSRPSLHEDFCVRFDSGGERLIRVSDDGHARCYSVPAGELLWEFLGARFGDARWLDGETVLFRPKWNGTAVILQRVTSPPPLLDYLQPTPIGLATAMDVSPDRSLSAVGATDGRTLVWNLAERAIWAILPGESAVLATEFSPDGSVLLTAHADGTMHRWPIDIERVARAAQPSLVSAPSAEPEPSAPAR